jgi:transposase-like protein
VALTLSARHELALQSIRQLEQLNPCVTRPESPWFRGFVIYSAMVVQLPRRQWGDAPPLLSVLNDLANAKLLECRADGPRRSDPEHVILSDARRLWVELKSVNGSSLTGIEVFVENLISVTETVDEKGQVETCRSYDLEGDPIFVVPVHKFVEWGIDNRSGMRSHEFLYRLTSTNQRRQRKTTRRRTKRINPSEPTDVQRAAYQLHRTGQSLRKIAELIGKPPHKHRVSHSTVSRWVNRVRSYDAANKSVATISTGTGEPIQQPRRQSDRIASIRKRNG